MVTPKRSDPGNRWYHVMNRGVRSLLIFASTKDRTVFLSYLAQLDSKFGVEVHSYCVMSNHYHLLLYSREGNLSAGMQWFASHYARYFNREYTYSGAVFEKRFLSKAVTSDSQLLQVSAYIHRNPLDIEPSRALDSYPWSSYASYVGTRIPPHWLTTDVVVSLANGPNRYREQVEHLPPGSVNGQFIASSGGEPRSCDLTESIDRAVAQAMGVEVAAVHKVRSGVSNPPRDLAMTLASKSGLLTSERIASHYGFASTQSARRSVQRSTKRVEGSSLLGTHFAALYQSLFDHNLSRPQRTRQVDPAGAGQSRRIPGSFGDRIREMPEAS